MAVSWRDETAACGRVDELSDCAVIARLEYSTVTTTTTTTTTSSSSSSCSHSTSVSSALEIF